MSPVEIYGLLPPFAQAACDKVAIALFSKAASFVGGKIAAKAALAAIYSRWQESFQDGEGVEEQLNAAFEEFFCRKRVVDELGKLVGDRYADVDFEVLVEELRDSFEFAGCPLPDTDLHREIDGSVRDLRTLLEENAQYRKDNLIGVQRAVRDTRSAGALIENDTLARKKYLDSVARQHRYIRFSGMAVVDERAEVEMARVFVMPRWIEQQGGGRFERREPIAVAAQKVITAKDAPRRMVILGGPGSGKTTLLEALALAFVQKEEFEWVKGFPELLPVFYRIRDLDKDLETHGTVWDCIQHHCSRRMGESLPLGFFTRQLDTCGVALLFDGLDEASSLVRRNEIVDLIGEVAEQLQTNSRLIVSSRPHDYRHRFEDASWKHFDLAEFDDGEVQTFIGGWQKIHEPDKEAAKEQGKELWEALERRKDILPLARNALLLTMIVRVHFGLGALPDSRLRLYENCTQTLLQHWAEPKGLAESPIDAAQKRKLLQRLAYEMQGEAEKLDADLTLQIGRAELARRFAKYLKHEGCGDAFHLVEKVIERLHARDAILVQYDTDKRGQDGFGFVHRSFQEYFAAGWMAHEVEEDEFRKELVAEREGWNETLYLAVAQLPDKRRRNTLLELLKRGRAEFAAECLKTAVPEQPWLRMLVQFLARYTPEGREYLNLSAGDCADACSGRMETWTVLRVMFERENREGRSLAAAVELAEELRSRKHGEAGSLLDAFYSEAADLREDMIEVEAGAFPFGHANELVDLAAFAIDRYPITNVEYERMLPGHRELRSEDSEADTQPAIYVSWFEARLYARWRGRGCRLPSEEEWEKAAGWDTDGRTKRVYPWGDEFDNVRCNTRESKLGKTTPVDAYPVGASAYGGRDMAGNVCEWTESLWNEGNEERIVRGGCWDSTYDYAACVSSLVVDPDDRGNIIGFRCARTLHSGGIDTEAGRWLVG